MKEISADSELVAHCGLYCGACKRYLTEKCSGCKENVKAAWCKIRSCCIENSYKSCADCGDYKDPMDCKKFNNIMAKLFAVIFRSNRKACIEMIKDKGYEEFAAYMTENELQSIKR
ncbi:DUF3795 domain-containing protein [Candidatus Latescibacterota bacterium]